MYRYLMRAALARRKGFTMIRRGMKKAAFWQMGDRAICFHIRTEDTMPHAFWPSRGEYANATGFVTDANAAEELNFVIGSRAHLACRHI